MTKKETICLFDSGIGGFTVLKKMMHSSPENDYIYLANLADMPFGDKTKNEIINIANKNIEWLSSFNPKSIIMACNTSSSLISELKKSTCEVKGIIQPAAKDVAESNYKKITVWATKLTVSNNAYKNEITKVNPSIVVEQIECPKLVPLIENLSSTETEKENTIMEYLTKTSIDTDALIWGCTHYPLLNSIFKKVSKIKTIDPSESLLKSMNYTESSLKSSVQIYTTAQKNKVEQFAKYYLQENYSVKEITLSKQTAQ